MLISPEDIPPSKTEFSQEISFNDDDSLEPAEQTFQNELRDEIQTHSAGKYFFMGFIRSSSSLIFYFI